ncbi:MAG: tyrosine-type recombinase/integrase [Desulfomonilaceae bacterium]
MKRGETWHIQKTIAGRRVRQSTGTDSLEEAERYLDHVTEEIRRTKVYGERPQRTFAEAAAKYLDEADKASLWVDAIQIKMLRPFIGHLKLEQIHMGTLQPFIEARRYRKLKDGTMKRNKVRTINYGLQTVRHILNLAAGEWIDENGMTWMAAAPKIKFLPEKDKQKPYPLSWVEQDRLFGELPDHLVRMALFKVNTGCREAEVCGLKWEWESPCPELSTFVFVIPGRHRKNGDDHVVVLNRTALAVIEQVRGEHPEYVFTYRGKPVKRMYDSAWKSARLRAGLPQVRVHDLKHTYGRRLRAADVPEEDRKDLLGHKHGRSITTHYSRAEIAKLIAYSNRVCLDERHKSDTSVFLEKKNRREQSTQVGGISR